MSYYEHYSVEEPVTWKTYDRSFSVYNSDGRPYHANAVVLHASMCCEKCVEKVRKSLNYVEGVESVDVDIRRQKVTVRGHVDPDTVLRKVHKQNKTATFWDRSDDHANYTFDAYDRDYYRPTSSNIYYGQSPASDYAIYISGADDYHRPASSYNRPASTYNRPASTYNRPALTYNRPASTYNRPASTYNHPDSSYSYYDQSPSYDSYFGSYLRPTEYSRQDYSYDDRYPSSPVYAGRHNDYRSYHRSYDTYRHH